ncbi:hypothetical protein K1719_033802 [Acacia pycnantha]|nr:hypothetical protein K1719_033802 [Acacia pycnantha]
MGPLVATQLATGLGVLAGAVLVKSVMDQKPMAGPFPRCPTCNGSGQQLWRLRNRTALTLKTHRSPAESLHSLIHRSDSRFAVAGFFLETPKWLKKVYGI